MKKAWIKFSLAIFLIVIVLGFLFMFPFVGNVIGQFPTVDFPTVTSSPRGPYIVVIFDPSINVRKGPSQLTEQIGLLLIGQEANALGRYGDWIQIEYSGGPSGKGWVFSNRFPRALRRLTDLIKGFRERKGSLQVQKDRDLFHYI